MALFEKKYKLEDLFVGSLRHPIKFSYENGGTLTHEFREYILFTNKEVKAHRILGKITSIDGRRFVYDLSTYSDFICDIKPLALYCNDIKEMSKKKYTKVDVLEVQRELTLKQLECNGEK